MADVATTLDSEPVTLSSLENMDEFQRVTVNIKVLELKDETQVMGRAKRDVFVADGSGTVRVSVWEENINVMEKDRSYCLKNFMVRGMKYLRKVQILPPLRILELWSKKKKTKMMSCG